MEKEYDCETAMLFLYVGVSNFEPFDWILGKSVGTYTIGEHLKQRTFKFPKLNSYKTADTRVCN